MLKLIIGCFMLLFPHLLPHKELDEYNRCKLTPQKPEKKVKKFGFFKKIISFVTSLKEI